MLAEQLKVGDLVKLYSGDPLEVAWVEGSDQVVRLSNGLLVHAVHLRPAGPASKELEEMGAEWTATRRIKGEYVSGWWLNGVFLGDKTDLALKAAKA